MYPRNGCSLHRWTLEVGFNYDIMGDILPATKLYHYRSLVFAYHIGNGNYGVVYLEKQKIPVCRKFVRMMNRIDNVKTE